MDRRITDLAKKQHGAVSRRQLLKLGVPPDTIRSLVRSRRLLPVSNGVYVVPGSAATPEQEAFVAALRCGPDARVAGERMLAFLGVHGADRTAPLEVLTRPGRRVRGVSWSVRENPLAVRTDGALVLEVPSFTPARLVVELAVRASDDDLERLVDGVRWSRFDLGSVRARALAVPEHPGARRLLASDLIVEDASESPPERTMFWSLEHLGATRQVDICEGCRADVVIEHAKQVFEYDGEATHGGRRAQAKDARWDQRAARAGYAVKRVRKAQLDDLPAFVQWAEAVVTARLGDLAATAPHPT